MASKKPLGVDGCPGADDIKRPKPELRTCPGCGSEIEIWSDEENANCGKCGKTVYNDRNLCVQWCEHVEKCIGNTKNSKKP